MTGNEKPIDAVGNRTYLDVSPVRTSMYDIFRRLELIAEEQYANDIGAASTTHEAATVQSVSFHLERARRCVCPSKLFREAKLSKPSISFASPWRSEDP